MPRTKSAKPRKTFAVSLDPELMREVQHLALDRDKWANELVEEALQDLLKKYAGAKRKSGG
jgi:predicted transcriptional regulator